uniref:Cysteine rich secretory protein 3 n=1 Tax=Propithecus coquereli TaxID=379532 RepID=A0A2K6GG24_PROCO
MSLRSSCTKRSNSGLCSICFVVPAMTLFLVLLFLAAGLLPCFPADGYEDPEFASVLTSRKEVQREIVDKHNELRRAVSPPASNMLKMEWNSQTAANAQKWANQCTYQHSTAQFRRTSTCGENLFMSSAITSWSSAIQNWDDEKYDLIFAVGPKTPNAVVGHYTQVKGRSKTPSALSKYLPSMLHINLYENVSVEIINSNVCKYEDKYSNCKQLKEQLGCTHQLVKDSCKAACNCQNKIY